MLERHNGIELDPEGAFVYYADAQATVEALQRQVMHLDKTLADVYAQRDGLQRERDVLRRQVDTQRRTIQRYQASHDEHTQLQALVRALPVVGGDIELDIYGYVWAGRVLSLIHI
jgi:septal ring factor EnvC (AmiA/AmiB activator)